MPSALLYGLYGLVGHPLAGGVDDEPPTAKAESFRRFYRTLLGGNVFENSSMHGMFDVAATA